ncbi:MAG: DEAD/DEAH box helicase family protein, partial [Desulfovibrionales bacterium]|nr:DEAD/DEAH box helicase family protein [Desulfovibrionales bacterium]
MNIISGVSTEVLASRLGDSFIDQVAGEDVVALLEKLHSAGQLSSARTKLCSRLLRERYAEYFLNKKQLKKIFSVLTENELDELQSRLGFTDRTQLLSFTVEEYPNCFEKFLGFFGIQASQLAKITSLKPCEPVVPAYGLFLHQDVAAKKVEKFLADPYSRVVLHMPTGAGKTRTAMHVVCNFLKKEK